MQKLKIKTLMMLLLTFSAGWTGSAISNGTINSGLVKALDSILSNLMSDTSAGASVRPVLNSGGESVDAVQFDFSHLLVTPVRANVFYPPDPVTPSPLDCRVVARLSVVNGDITVTIDNEHESDVAVVYDNNPAFLGGDLCSTS